MFQPALVACSLAVLGAVPAGPEVKEGPPRQPAPSFNYVSAVNQGTGVISLLHTVTKQVAVPVQRTVIVNGVNQIITEYRYVQQTSQQVTSFSLKKGTVYSTEGKKLTETEVLERLKPGAIVLESTNGQPVDPLFLRAVRPETLVLVGPLPMPTAVPAIRPAAIVVPAPGGAPVPVPAPKNVPPAPQP